MFACWACLQSCTFLFAGSQKCHLVVDHALVGSGGGVFQTVCVHYLAHCNCKWGCYNLSCKLVASCGWYISVRHYYIRVLHSVGNEEEQGDIYTEWVNSSVARFARKFCGSSSCRWAIPQLLCSQARRNLWEKLTQKLSTKPCDQAIDALFILEEDDGVTPNNN